VPNAGAPILDVGEAGPAAAAAFTVQLQLDAQQKPAPRAVKGAGIDLGAVEL
jgi:hypothetical protein